MSAIVTGNPPARLYTEAYVRKLLGGKSRSTLRRWETKGLLPKRLKGLGTQGMYDAAKVDEAIQKILGEVK